MFVYFVKCKDSIGLIKIGYAVDPKKRLAVLQTGCPYPLELIGTFQCSNLPECRLREKQLHELFCYCWKNGEWFSPDKKLREAIAALSIGVDFEDMRTAAKAKSKSKYQKYVRHGKGKTRTGW